MHELDVDRVVASPVHVGSGQVRCAHGILPVPAPATAHILKQVPIYGGSIRGELCTPTGAALLKYFVEVFGEMPAMAVSGIGYGMGKKDFERANCVRVLLGETAKVNCKECEVRLEEALMRIQGVNAAVVQMAVKQVQMDSSLDMAALEEALEDVGLFAQ